MKENIALVTLEEKLAEVSSSFHNFLNPVDPFMKTALQRDFEWYIETKKQYEKILIISIQHWH